MKIICIPGLGGHENVFANYAQDLAEFDVETVSLIDWRKTHEEVSRIVNASDTVIFLCNCYGAQIALRAMYARPSKTIAFIVIEPFFAEFFSWAWMAEFFIGLLLFVKKFTDMLGLKRKTYTEVDYSKVEEYPLFLQPFFDMQHQSLTDYFTKMEDIATFRLPVRVDTKTLFIFSPGGFMKDGAKREKLQSIFVHSEVVEMGEKSHNIVTLSRKQLVNVIIDFVRKTEQEVEYPS